MREEWRPVVSYEGLYEVSNMGRVKSVKRTVWNSGKGCYKTISERVLKPIKDKKGYLVVNLHRDGAKKMYQIHRLVAIAFIANPQNLPCVNHKNEVKTDNSLQNLEWCSYSYNNSYGIGNKNRAEKLSKPVIGVDKVTGLIVEFGSAKEAERKLGVSNKHICSCCKGKRKSHGGFYWYYADTEQ